MTLHLTERQKKDILELVNTVGRFQISQQKEIASLKIDDKGLNQLVSKVDVESEKMLVEGLQKITPNCGFITEESTVNQKKEDFTWIIDPLDGTTNYLFGLDIYAISIALYYQQQPIFGCVNIPLKNEVFTADESGAFLNGNKIAVSTRHSLNTTLLATGFPYYKFDELPEYLEILKYLMQNSRGLRRMGSAAIDLVYVASGIFDGFFELNLSPWDVAAGAYIVQQAGGTVSSFTQNQDYVFGNSILASNSFIHDNMKELLVEKLNSSTS